MTIRCLYACATCKVSEAAVDVPARGEEDVTVWMTEAIRMVWRDHKRRSPLCPAEKVSALKIPMIGAKKVGGPVIQ